MLFFFLIPRVLHLALLLHCPEEAQFILRREEIKQSAFVNRGNVYDVDFLTVIAQAEEHSRSAVSNAFSA